MQNELCLVSSQQKAGVPKVNPHKGPGAVYRALLHILRDEHVRDSMLHLWNHKTAVNIKNMPIDEVMIYAKFVNVFYDEFTRRGLSTYRFNN